MGYSINEEANPKDMENYYSKEEQEKYDSQKEIYNLLIL